LSDPSRALTSEPKGNMICERLGIHSKPIPGCWCHP